MVGDVVAPPPAAEVHWVMRPADGALLVMPGEKHVYSVDGSTWWRYVDGPPLIVELERYRSSWVRTTRPDLIGMVPAGARL